MTIGGNSLDLTSGSPIRSPSRMRARASRMASDMITLETMPATVSRACKIGTPLTSRVPSVREKRDSMTFWVSLPKTGSLSLTRSQTWLPNLVLLKAL